MLYFFFDLEGLVVSKADDGGNGFKEGLVDINIGFCVDGEVSQVEKLNDPGFLIGFFVKAVAGQLLLDKLAGS